MNVLHIVDDHGRVVLEPEGFFVHPANRYREIEVTDPEDPYGTPIYRGSAWEAAKALEPGAYWWEYVDDDVYSD